MTLLPHNILQHPAIFRVGDVPLQPLQTLRTGFAALDLELSGGWPRAKLTEILCDQMGVGELSLLLRAHNSSHNSSHNPARKADAEAASGDIIWIRPHDTKPLLIPYAPALAQQGIDLSRLTLVDTNNIADTLWATEQALMSGCARIVMTWLTPAKQHPHDFALRRLSQAVRRSDCVCLLMRPLEAAQHSSPAELRIAVRAMAHGELELQFIKRRTLVQNKSIRLNTRTLACLAAHRQARIAHHSKSSAAVDQRQPWIKGVAERAQVRQRSFILER